MYAQVLLFLVGAQSPKGADILSVEAGSEDQPLKLRVVQCAGVENDQAIVHRLVAQVGEQQAPNVRAGVGLKVVRR